MRDGNTKTDGTEIFLGGASQVLLESRYVCRSERGGDVMLASPLFIWLINGL